MAKRQCDFFSVSLMRTVTVNVILPTDKMILPGMPVPENRPFKTLYLLHGFFGNHTARSGGSGIDRWAQDKNLCVVMPGGENKFHGDNPRSSELYGAFIGKSLSSGREKASPSATGGRIPSSAVSQWAATALL